jgi:hypothetical protein
MEAAFTIPAILCISVTQRAKISPLSKAEPFIIFLPFVPDNTILLETWPFLGFPEPHLQKQQDSYFQDQCNITHISQKNRDK